MQKHPETQKCLKDLKNLTQDKIGDYVIEKTVGQGTFGKVKLGIHDFTGEKVAIKILQKDKILDEGDKLRVHREIKILKQIKHPNLIQLYEIIENETDLYLIMEYAANGELYEHIVKRKKLPESEAFNFFQQILSGIEYLHKLNISHRDLKLENLLLSYNNTIKIVDFGLSNFYQNTLLTSCGSPCYAAPEMILGQRYNGLKTDLWSLGIILFAMTCGYLPFENKDTGTMYRKVVKGEFETPKYLSDSIKTLIKGILTVDPKKRFSIEDIKNSVWYNACKVKNDYKGLIIGMHHIPIDGFILDVLENFNVNKKEAEIHLKKNHHNRYTSLYYLLLEKFIREGGCSSANIKSLDFSPKPIKIQKIDDSSQETIRKISDKNVSPTNKNIPNISCETKKTIEILKQQSPTQIQEISKVSNISIKELPNILISTSPKIINSKPIFQEKKPESNENQSIDEKTDKSFAAFQSDRFEKKTKANKSNETMRNLDIALKDKRNEALCNGTVKTEMSSFNKNNYIKPKQINEKKSKKSQSFFQTKLLITSPFVLNHYQNHYNTSTTNKSDNAKSFHQKYISQHLKEKKTNTQDTPIQNKEKQDSSSRFEKSKSIDISNNKSMGTKKILNITLMSMKRKIMNNPKTHERNKEKSISIEKIKENLDKALNKDKINSNKEEKNAALNNSSLAFFSQIPKNNKQNSSEFENTENNKKSYYQLASLLKEKNFSNKYASNKNNEENASRSRFKSMYTVKTEASSKKQDTQFNHFQNISQEKADSSNGSRSNSRSQSQIKNKIECQLNSFKMFTTKREEENENCYKILNPNNTLETNNANISINKVIFSSLKSPAQKIETKKKEQNLVNVERFLRYSQKFKNLKEMQKNLEKLLSKDSFLE